MQAIASSFAFVDTHSLLVLCYAYCVLTCRAKSLLLALLSTNPAAASLQQRTASATNSQQQSQQQQQQQQAPTDALSAITQQDERAATDSNPTQETAEAAGVASAAAVSHSNKGAAKHRGKAHAAATPVPTRCALDGLQFVFSDVRVIDGKFAAYRITLMVPVSSEQLLLLSDDTGNSSSSSNRQSAITDRALSVFGSLSGHGVQYCKWEVWRRISDFGALRYVTLSQ
jgi:hypothetical protein